MKRYTQANIKNGGKVEKPCCKFIVINKVINRC